MKNELFSSLDGKYLHEINVFFCFCFFFRKKKKFFKRKALPTLYCFLSSGMLTLFLLLQLIVRRNPVCVFTAVAGMSCSSVRTPQDCLLGNLLDFLANVQVR